MRDGIWIGALIIVAVVATLLERRRWTRDHPRTAIVVRDTRLAGDRVFMSNLNTLVDRAWEARPRKPPAVPIAELFDPYDQEEHHAQADH